MNNSKNEIRDDEFRVIGQASGHRPSRKKLMLWIILVSIVAVVFCLLAWCFFREKPEEDVQGVYEKELITEASHVVEPLSFLGDYSDTTCRAYTEHLQKTINDIPLDIYIPHNAVPALSIGTPDVQDKDIVLVTQAADIRADNGKIVGAFVLDGEPMAWGLSKKGYVAIIDGKVSVGVADNSPLFEEATEKGGYFFRQYPLVDNGKLVENEPKNKAIRKAICDRGGEIMVVMSTSRESFHDFAQALVDLQVDNAVYLVGSEYSYGYYRAKDDTFTQFAEKRRGGQKFENYILWRNLHNKQ